MRAIFAGAAFTLLVMTNAALAQNPAATAPGGAGGATRVAGQGRNGGQGRGGGRNAMGTITGGDMKAGTMVISSQFGGGSQTIKVNPDTKFTTQQIVTVGSLRAGDQVQVQGVPAVITASSITAGELPDFLQNNRNRGGRGAAPGGATPATPGAAAADPAVIDPNNPPQPTASATATGKVVSTNPLTIVINTNVTIILKLASGVKITKLTSVPFSSLKVGDKLIAAGTTDPDGTFTATGVGVNLDMGGRGMGVGGMGAFGGRGGGQGGQGGGRNRGNRAGAGTGTNGAATGGDAQNPPTK